LRLAAATPLESFKNLSFLNGRDGSEWQSHSVFSSGKARKSFPILFFVSLRFFLPNKPPSGEPSTPSSSQNARSTLAVAPGLQ